MKLGQARYALSSQQLWSGKERSFNYDLFYETLLKLFELDDEWREETLHWWNE